MSDIIIKPADKGLMYTIFRYGVIMFSPTPCSYYGRQVYYVKIEGKKQLCSTVYSRLNIFKSYPLSLGYFRLFTIIVLVFQIF